LQRGPQALHRSRQRARLLSVYSKASSSHPSVPHRCAKVNEVKFAKNRQRRSRNCPFLLGKQPFSRTACAASNAREIVPRNYRASAAGGSGRGAGEGADRWRPGKASFANAPRHDAGKFSLDFARHEAETRRRGSAAFGRGTVYERSAPRCDQISPDFRRDVQRNRK
jgi:hypothetical protein